jgi:hypothetical protein
MHFALEERGEPKMSTLSPLMHISTKVWDEKLRRRLEAAGHTTQAQAAKVASGHHHLCSFPCFPPQLIPLLSLCSALNPFQLKMEWQHWRTSVTA